MRFNKFLQICNLLLRLKKYGTNTIKKAAAESEWKTFFKNFFSMMAILLWISGLIAIVSGTLELGIAI
ncbi:cation-transporting P-type ATPase [Lactobacillus gallinarum]|uniref:cation-transporting P-type ATPase n=1 Tax=Lactobacillus gallinarum TaxID=52242 RepID=UPI00333EE39C